MACEEEGEDDTSGGVSGARNFLSGVRIVRIAHKARAAGGSGVMGSACAGLQWVILVFVCFARAWANILSGTARSLKQRLLSSPPLNESLAMPACSQVILRGVDGDF